MKITKSQLKQIIKEEMESVLKEQEVLRGARITKKKQDGDYWIVTVCLRDTCAEGKAKGATTSIAIRAAEQKARTNLLKKLKGND